MNPIFFPAILGRLLNKRECLKCKRPQIVSSAKKSRTVTCKFCGAAIPPKRPYR